MIYMRNIGDAEVWNVIECIGRSHARNNIDGQLAVGNFEPRLHWLAPHHYMPQIGQCLVAMQFWIVKNGQHLIVIDTGVGSAREDSMGPPAHRLSRATLERLRAEGATPENVTHFLSMQLHRDQVGWTVAPKSGKWKPTFPNAKYLVPRGSLGSCHRDGTGYDLSHMDGPFAQSVISLLDAGRFGYIEDDKSVCDYLQVERLLGQRPGALGFSLKAGGEQVIFCGDIMKDMAPMTRIAFLEDAARRSALIMPCHYGFPYGGYASGSRESGFTFVPDTGDPASGLQSERPDSTAEPSEGFLSPSGFLQSAPGHEHCSSSTVQYRVNGR